MSYVALYRKLRPKNFADVIGQDHIVRTLRNQLMSGRVSHAYLFCGTRGTGKTSTAKIFAQTVNCSNPQDGEPCHVCKACVEILNNRSVNVLEVDAASNNGVENIREIREEVKYPPATGTYKVYIIDEVHMLSIGAFNALLKTLEEPPDHVVFILATTDPQKIPPTIHSRCQRFDFKRIGVNVIADSLREYLAGEKNEADDDALRYIAEMADGAMRDAHSILDQAMAFYFDERITLEKVLDLLGAVDKSVFFELTDALNEMNGMKCLQIIDSIVMDGRDIGQFVADMTVHFRNLLVSANTEGRQVGLEASGENIARLAEQGKKIDGGALIHFVNTFAALSGQLRYAANERALLEITCIRLCNPSVENSMDTVFARMKKLEDRLDSGNFQINATTQVPASGGEKKKIMVKPRAMPDDFMKVRDGWAGFVRRFDAITLEILAQSSIESLDNDVLYIVAVDSASADFLKKYKLEQITGAMEQAFACTFNVQLIGRPDFMDKQYTLYGIRSDTPDYTDEDIYKFIKMSDVDIE